MFALRLKRESRRERMVALALRAFVVAAWNISALGADFSNGLFDMIGEEPVVERPAIFSAYSNDEPNDAPLDASPCDLAVDLSPIAPVDAFDGGVSCASFAPLDFTKEEAGSQEAFEFTGSGMAATSAPIIRGSVNLPSIKAMQFWGAAYSGSGRVKPVGYEKKITRNNTGASIGVNLPLGLATLSGFYNYHRDREFLPSSRIEQTDGSYGATIYLNTDGFYFAASGFYGSDEYRGRAAVGFGEDARLLRANFDGSQSAGYFETGYEMMGMGMFVLKPFGSYHYSNVRHDAFDPTTLSALPGKKKYNSCRMTLGSRVDINLAGLDFFTIQGRMAWITELRSKTESFSTFSYGRIPGDFSPASPYYFGNGAGSDYFWGGVGMRLSAFGMLSISIDYDCYFNKRQRLHEGGLGLLFGF